jgi:hypothetical protein
MLSFRLSLIWLVCLVGFLALPLSVSNARVWRIHLDASGDAPTIQAGIDSAQAGDVVFLEEFGTYTWTDQGATGESMIRMKRDVILRGRGRNMTSIHAQRNGRVIECIDCGDASLENIGILGGRVVGTDARGAGVYSVGDSRLQLHSCEFAENKVEGTARGFGGGLYLTNASIFGGLIAHNSATGDSALGGGAYLVGCSISRIPVVGNQCNAGNVALGGGVFANFSVVAGVEFWDNEAVGGISRGGALHIAGGRMDGGFGTRNVATQGGAVYVSDAVITGCLFVEHGFRSPGGGVIESDIGDLPSQVVNCTLANNRAGRSLMGPSTVIYLRAGGEVRNTIVTANDGAACLGPVSVSCSNFFGNALGDVIPGTDAGGNFSVDPMFCFLAPPGGQWHIRADSPCAPGNHPDGDSCGLIGGRDVGCLTAVEQARWGDVKALYR